MGPKEGSSVKRTAWALGLAGLLVPGVSLAANIFEAMGGAFVGVADDATALFWNAAGIARIDPDKSELSLNHANWPADLSFDQVGYVFHMKKIPGAFGIH